MSLKLLKNGWFLLLVTLIVAAPLQRSQAAIFDAQAVIKLVNQERTDRGIESLAIDKELSQAATEKANDMFVHNYFAHVSPSGVTPWQWIGQSGYDYSFAGENLAINFTDPQSQHEAFMKSDSHKKNILNLKYKEIGVAVATGTMNGKQTIITVQEFGAKTTEAPIEKTVAGVSSNNLPISKVSLTKNFQNNISSIFNAATAKFSILKKNISPVPFVASLYIITLLIAFAFFACEMFGTNFHFAIHFFSLHRKPKLFSTSSKEPLPYFPPFNLDLISQVKKIYLTHMKMKK